jgi:hypothetical protein
VTERCCLDNGGWWGGSGVPSYTPGVLSSRLLLVNRYRAHRVYIVFSTGRRDLETMVKTKVKFFVSYAHLDEPACVKLLKLLQIQMAPSANYEFELWDDRAILAGEAWKREILQAIDESDIGLLLVSPAFLGSPFITNEELPKFVGDESKPAIPVELQKVDFKRHDLKGLDQQQLFRLDRDKAFGNCTTAQTQTRFAEQLYSQIEQRLERLGF